MESNWPFNCTQLLNCLSVTPDVITALLCHPLMGLCFPSLHMDLSDMYINPPQLQSLTANPPLTQMHIHTKTQTNAVQHHVTILCNEAKALNMTYGDRSPSRDIIAVQLCVVYLSEGARSVSPDTGESCCCHNHPGGEEPEQRDTEGEGAKGFTGIQLPSRKC